MRKMTLLGAIALAALLVLAGCVTISSPPEPKPQEQQGPAASGAQQQSGQASAAPAERNIRGTVPQFIIDAVNNTPEDALVGIGTGNFRLESDALKYVPLRARSEILRQVESMMRDMLRDYSSTSEVDPDATLAFQEGFTRSLAEGKLKSAQVTNMNKTQNGSYWIVAVMPKGDVKEAVNHAAAAAKQKVPKMASFDAEARMDEEFEKQKQREIQVRDTD